MTVKEFYDSIGADYNEIMGRLGNEMIIERFVRKFEADKCFQALCEAMDAKDYEAAFRGAHTLKGVCQNLGFSNIYKPLSQLTDELRGGKSPEHPGLFDEVSEEYHKTIDAIKKL